MKYDPLFSMIIITSSAPKPHMSMIMLMRIFFHDHQFHLNHPMVFGTRTLTILQLPANVPVHDGQIHHGVRSGARERALGCPLDVGILNTIHDIESIMNLL